MKNLGLVVAGSVLSLSAFAQDGVTVGGYVDAGYTTVMMDKVAGVEQADMNGFLVREGAIYLGKKWGTEWEVFGDFSFGQSFDSVTGNPGAIGNLEVAQAFVGQNMDNGFSWKLGKMDTVFGYYAGRGDSHAHRLTDVGYIQAVYLPASHLGWLASYSFSDMLKVSFLVANEDESFGTSGEAGSTATGRGTRAADFGLLVGADFDAFSADVGAYIMTGETATKTATGYVVSAVVEGNFNPLTFGVYGVYSKNDADATAPAKDEADFGIGANVGYDVNEQFGADLRLEYVGMSDKSSFYNPITGVWTSLGAIPTVEVESFMGATIGGHYKFNDNVKAKFDYTYAKFETKGTGVDMDPAHIVQAGVVANF
jgi:hypothetical protein